MKRREYCTYLRINMLDVLPVCNVHMCNTAVFRITLVHFKSGPTFQMALFKGDAHYLSVMTSKPNINPIMLCLYTILYVVILSVIVFS